VQTAGIVLNYPRPGDGGLPERTNPALLQRLTGPPLLGIVPHIDCFGIKAVEAAAEALHVEALLYY